jgi:carbon storage regulator CsrA
MLILTHRVTELLMIGENVQVTVLGIDGNQVRYPIPANAALWRPCGRVGSLVAAVAPIL